MSQKGYYGLEYVTVEFEGENVPASLIDEVDRAVSKFILEHRSPLRGIEVKFIRKTLGLSLAAVAEKLGYTAPGIQKWEKAERERLTPTNEVAVRVLFAELMGITLAGKWTELLGTDKPEPLTITRKAS